MKRHSFGRCCALACAVASFALTLSLRAASTLGATPTSLIIQVTENYARSSYEVSYLSVGAATSPTGEVLLTNNGAQRTFTSWEQLTANLFGQWSWGLSDPYLFTISPFSYETITAVAPTILSPADGATVTSPFVITTTPGIHGSSLAASGVKDLDVTQFSATQREVSFGQLLSNPSMTFTVGGPYQSLDQFISPVTPPGANATWDLDVFLSFNRQSRAVYTPVAPVPEPTSAVMLPLACVPLMASRVARNQRRRRLAQGSFCAEKST